MTWREISPLGLNNLKNPLIIDVRSPLESLKESLPGAVNVPLLSDEERQLIGILYKQCGAAHARLEAVKVIGPKVFSLVETILKLRKPGQQIVVSCWRGGLRSEAVASFLSLVGVDCWRLQGGYKGFRTLIISQLEGQHSFIPFVLHGLTGCGKTEILNRLSSRGLPVLNLEALANHRGSVFGGIGLSDQPTQKNFDAALWQALNGCKEAPLFLESESRKIGKISLPRSIMDKIKQGVHILVSSSLDTRARRIVKDYAPGFDAQMLVQAVSALSNLKERLGAESVRSIAQLFEQGQLTPAVKRLLVEYYDPLYNREIARFQPYDLVVDSDDLEPAVESIAGFSRDKSCPGVSIG